MAAFGLSRSFKGRAQSETPTLSTLPDRAELFSYTGGVTITERQLMKSLACVCFPLSKYKALWDLFYKHPPPHTQSSYGV